MSRCSIIVMGLLVTVSSSARANKEDKEIAIANMLSPLGNAVRWNGPSKGWGGGGDEIKEIRDRCREALADAKKAGVKPGDKITAWSGFEKNPKAKVVGEKVVFSFADAAWYCDDLDKRTVHWDLVLRLADGKKLEARVKTGLTETEKKDIAPELFEYTVDIAARCKAALQAELASGATSVEVEGATIALSDAGAICDTSSPGAICKRRRGPSARRSSAPSMRRSASRAPGWSCSSITTTSRAGTCPAARSRRWTPRH
jgi:hypothetical protein